MKYTGWGSLHAWACGITFLGFVFLLLSGGHVAVYRFTSMALLGVIAVHITAVRDHS